jgi:hypothetical protein
LLIVTRRSMGSTSGRKVVAGSGNSSIRMLLRRPFHFDLSLAIKPSGTVSQQMYVSLKTYDG